MQDDDAAAVHSDAAAPVHPAAAAVHSDAGAPMHPAASAASAADVVPSGHDRIAQLPDDDNGQPVRWQPGWTRPEQSSSPTSQSASSSAAGLPETGASTGSLLTALFGLLLVAGAAMVAGRARAKA